MGKSVKLGVTLAVALSLSACVSTYRNHGYTPPEEDLANIIVGVDTRATVEDTLGTPTAQGVSTQTGVYYVSSRWRHFGAMRPRPIERQVVAINFDASDVVQNITRYGLEDGRVITLNRRVTDGGAQEISFIRQLMGNAGRVTAQDVFGGS